MILTVLGPLSGAEPPLKESWPTAVTRICDPVGLQWALQGDGVLPDEVERYATDLIKGWSGPACVADVGHKAAAGQLSVLTLAPFLGACGASRGGC